MQSSVSSPAVPNGRHYVVVVLGASGDLAKKKTYPALFGLYKFGFLPPSTAIIGYARTEMTNQEFREKISSTLKAQNEKQELQKKDFLEMLTYLPGSYDKDESFKKLEGEIAALEKKVGFSTNSMRIFYMALPPSVFVQVAQGIKRNVYNPLLVQRLVIEKPFGKDSDSAADLLGSLANLFKEEEMYRIDHYLGKEMVKNLMVIRFANVFFTACWNRQYIDNIQITFKETIGKCFDFILRRN
jgi:glucose-6-phosphate 1-dehydrogenase